VCRRWLMAEEISDALLKAFADAQPPETPEQEAARLKRIEEEKAWRKKQEEAVTFAVPREIEALRKEAAEKLAAADKLAALLALYPNLRQRTGRWKKVVYYSPDVNKVVERFDIRHNCGCCNDSPLEIWPYLETPHGNVYSDPPEFRVGQKEPFYGGDVPRKGWEQEMRSAEIPDVIIGAVSTHFKRSASEAKELAASIYDGEERDPDPEPFV
jgi:hypothetical protein